MGHPSAQSGVSAPVLMWQYGGCLSGPHCQTGWYSSPAVADLDSDGRPEVMWDAGDVVALNGANGALKWRAPSSSRVWSGVAVADLTGDGTLEVIAGRNSDQLAVYDRFGNTMWTRSPFGSGEIRTLAVADLEHDGRLEIIVGTAGFASFQVNVFEPDGTVRAGWPVRHSGDPGSGSGLWNQNVVVADMNGDGFKEVVTTTGSHYVTAVDRNGNQLSVSGVYAPQQFWSEVGTAVDKAAEVRGWVNCGVENRPDLSASAPVIADLNGDGVPEFVMVGNVYHCGTSPYTDLDHMPFIFKLDRSRWSGSGFDWNVIPSPGPGSAPRSEDFTVIESVQPNAVVGDLDGDGFKEILFPSYDGKLHAYWLDKTEHGSWPYTIPASGASGDDFRFASEPLIVDLNNDGHAEVIFSSWPKKSTGRVGQLHILDYLGHELYRIDLPAPAIGAAWNGALGAPTIANIDSDPDLELVVGTLASGVVAYKLPNSANARIAWGTGRASYTRTGVATPLGAPARHDATDGLDHGARERGDGRGNHDGQCQRVGQCRRGRRAVPPRWREPRRGRHRGAVFHRVEYDDREQRLAHADSGCARRGGQHRHGGGASRNGRQQRGQSDADRRDHHGGLLPQGLDAGLHGGARWTSELNVAPIASARTHSVPGAANTTLNTPNAMRPRVSQIDQVG